MFHTVQRVLTLVLLAVLSNSARGQNLSGHYSGAINGTRATLELYQDGNVLEGAVQAGGYRSLLAGTLQGVRARGTVTDPEEGVTVDFEATVGERTFDLVLLVPDEAGAIVRVPISFAKAAAESPERGSAGENRETAQGVRDPALVGHWTRQEVMISGGFSLATEWDLLLDADGRFFYGDGRSVGGGSNDYGDVSIDTGDSGEGTRGSWRTEGGIVYVKTPDMPEWTAYARYYIEGGQMLLTFEDGSKQLWHRQ